MINTRVRFQRFRIYEGWKWEFGSEGIIKAETETAYKVKTGWFSSEWVEKDKIEVIIN